MSSESTKRGETEQDKVGTPEAKPVSALDPSKIDAAAENEMRKKYGFKKGPPGIAQRKISSTGGKQYFDSGDYNMSDRKDKQEIASHPHARNPRLAHLRPRGVPHPAQPSKLAAAGGTGKPPLVE